MVIKKLAAMLLLPVGLAACSTEPVSKSHAHVTPDKRHWGVQMSMYTGVPNTPVQTVMVVYNKYQKTPIAVVNGQTKTMDRQLWEDLLGVVNSVGPAAITGHAIVKAAEAECPPTALCGTLVQVQNSAGASADSTSSATRQGE